jgi:hypothetical protein
MMAAKLIGAGLATIALAGYVLFLELIEEYLVIDPAPHTGTVFSLAIHILFTALLMVMALIFLYAF